MHRTGTIRLIGRMVSSHRNEPVRYCTRITPPSEPVRTLAAGCLGGLNGSLRYPRSMPEPSHEPRMAGRVQLGNPANSGTPRPRGACRVLMIGDVIGKPGREAR